MPDSNFVWLPEVGLGHYPVTEKPYDAAYWAKYVGYAGTTMGRRINGARNALVARYWDGAVLDVGIGCGQFVEGRPNTRGYDVNPVGMAWLLERDLWTDPYLGVSSAVTLWDVFEHIHEPDKLLENVAQWVFMSLPIFDGPDHVLRSKHYRTDEHVWYFTRRGLLHFMEENGFRCVEHNTAESLLGREDIGSFAFRRLADG